MSGAGQLGISSEQVFELLGEHTVDIYLNEIAYWRNMPFKVWDYTIGCYRVIKKWLSHREADLIGRPLAPEESREVTNMARRIAGIILLQPMLDENYHKVKASTYEWLNVEP